ncbi:MAG: hypothetical protein ACRDGS_10375 [Chloroflexota bacterium]
MQTIEAHYTLARVARLFSDRPVVTESGIFSPRVIASSLYDASWLLQASLEADDGTACTGSASTLAQAVALLEAVAAQTSQGSLLKLYLDACYALSAGEDNTVLQLGTRIAVALEAPDIDSLALQLLRQITGDALRHMPQASVTQAMARIAQAAANQRRLEDALAGWPAALEILQQAAIGRDDLSQETERLEMETLLIALEVACRHAGVHQALLTKALSAGRDREGGTGARWALLAGAELPLEPGAKLSAEDDRNLKAALTAFFSGERQRAWPPIGTVLAGQAWRSRFHEALLEAIEHLPVPGLRISLLGAAVAALNGQEPPATRLLALNAWLTEELPKEWHGRVAMLRQPIRRAIPAA